jgi:5'-deoxynucleotidase YfbR-like HD superfamily hydrolase
VFDKEKLKEIKDILDFARQNNRLSYLERYSTTPHLFKESVADHSYQVNILSLYLYEKYKNKVELNFERLIRQALIHDEAESDETIGDIPHPIKIGNPTLKIELEELEYKVLETLLGKEYRDLLEEFNNCHTIESMLVNIADCISCLVYAESEIAKGNSYMNRVKFESEERIIELIDRVNKYLLKNKKHE